MSVRFAFLPIAVGLASQIGGPAEAVRGARPDEQALYELIASAQASNLQSYEQGRLGFTVVFQPAIHPIYGPFRPVRVRGNVVWRGDKALWVYKVQDPDGYIFYESEAGIDEAPTEFLLVDGGTRHAFDYKTNKLYVKALPNGAASSFLLDVTPLSHWFRCCPPQHRSGRPWIELIGPSAPSMKPGDTIAIERDGDLIRQTRSFEGGTTSVMTFSLEWDGNVVHHRYDGDRREEISYEWGRSPGGACVLRRCEATFFMPGSESEVETDYTLTIDSVDLSRPVRPSEVSRAALIAMLPRDVLIDDRVAKKRYFANPDVKVPATRLERLAEAIAGEGFLERKD